MGYSLSQATVVYNKIYMAFYLPSGTMGAKPALGLTVTKSTGGRGSASEKLRMAKKRTASFIFVGQ